MLNLKFFILQKFHRGGILLSSGGKGRTGNKIGEQLVSRMVQLHTTVALETVGDYLYLACLHLQLQNHISFHAASTSFSCSLSLTFSLIIIIFLLKNNLQLCPFLVTGTQTENKGKRQQTRMKKRQQSNRMLPCDHTCCDKWSQCLRLMGLIKW